MSYMYIYIKCILWLRGVGVISAVCMCLCVCVCAGDQSQYGGEDRSRHHHQSGLYTQGSKILAPWGLNIGPLAIGTNNVHVHDFIKRGPKFVHCLDP